MLKIIIIIIGYTLNNFTTHITILQQMMEIYIISKTKKRIHFGKKKNYSFCQCGNSPQATVLGLGSIQTRSGARYSMNIYPLEMNKNWFQLYTCYIHGYVKEYNHIVTYAPLHNHTTGVKPIAIFGVHHFYVLKGSQKN